MPASPGRLSVGHVGAVARAAASRCEHLGRLRATGVAPAATSALAQRRPPGGADQQVDAGVGARPASTVAPRPASANACSAVGAAPAPSAARRPRRRAGPISESIDALGACGRRSRPDARSCTCGGRAAPPRARRPRCRATARSGAAREDPHVGQDAALRVQHRGVAAGARLERLHVVGDLALEELGGVGPAHVERARARRDRAGRRPRAGRRTVLDRRAARCVAIDSIVGWR